MKLLDGILVLDFAQYLAGPWAASKLGDLGARVIKIERHNGGDKSRTLSLCNLYVDGDSTFYRVYSAIRLREKRRFIRNVYS